MQLDFCPQCFKIKEGNFCSKCGFAISSYSAPGTALKPGTIIDGKYKIGMVLGIGGFGVTYTCCDIATNAVYAIKEYMPSGIAVREETGRVSIANSGDKDIYNSGLQAFIDETNTLLRLKGTPGVVEAYNLVTDNNTAYLVMEYLDSITLKSLLKQNGTLNSDFSLGILFKVANALNAIHAKGLLHRDISPENIMISNDGNNNVTLIDFGAARVFVGGRSRNMSRVLKPGYAPPEQYSENGHHGEWTDIYALAATYYKLVTGKTPPDAPTRLQNDTVRRLDKDYVGVAPHIGKAIHKALSLNARDRYRNMTQFAAALKMKPDDRIFRDEEVSKVSTPKTEPPPPPPPKKNENAFSRFFSRSSSGSSKSSEGNGRRKSNLDMGIKRRGDLSHQAIKRPYVRIVRGPVVIGNWQIVGDTEINVGRDGAICTLVVYDSSVSRKHCSVKYDTASGNFIIVDYSSNGTYLGNGSRMTPYGEYIFSPGSFVMLASQDFIMEVYVNNE